MIFSRWPCCDGQMNVVARQIIEVVRQIWRACGEHICSSLILLTFCTGLISYLTVLFFPFTCLTVLSLVFLFFHFSCLIRRGFFSLSLASSSFPFCSSSNCTFNFDLYDLDHLNHPDHLDRHDRHEIPMTTMTVTTYLPMAIPMLININIKYQTSNIQLASVHDQP